MKPGFRIQDSGFRNRKPRRGSRIVALVSVCVMAVLCVASALAEAGWAASVPPAPSAEQSRKFGLRPLDFQTSFCETNVGRFGPNVRHTGVGVPGFAPTVFGDEMRARYSEFDLVFGMAEPNDGVRHMWTQDNLTQECPGRWLPGSVHKWTDQGTSYRVTFISVPHDPVPVDMYEIVLKNTSDQPSQAHLVATLDGAPSLKAEGDLISDRGKPLAVMDPIVPTERIFRDFGVVDPRNTSCSAWRGGGSAWKDCRIGWYGMPVEYMLKAKPGESLQVFLGFLSHNALCQEIIAQVEGDPNPQRKELPNSDNPTQPDSRQALRFVGKDTDGDGYIKISVQSPPELPKPARISKARAFDDSTVWLYGKSDANALCQRPIISLIAAFDANATVTPEDVIGDKVQLNLSEEMLKRSPALMSGEDSAAARNRARYWIDCGLDWPCCPGTRAVEKDPTVFALRLRYEPKLAAGEEKRYLLRLPAIDRPEPAPDGEIWRPYDTGDTWKSYFEARFPGNPTPYGVDVPPGTKPSDYAINGPHSKAVWNKQLEDARTMTWEQAVKTLTNYWEGAVSKRARFITPEPVLDDMYKHQLAVIKLFLLKLGSDDRMVSLSGPSYYWEFALARDWTYLNDAFETAGYHDIAETLLDTELTPRSKLPHSRWTLGQWDDADPQFNGAWLTRGGQIDAEGETLYIIAEHYFMTGDKKWLSEHYDSVTRAGEWLIRARQRVKETTKPDDPRYGLLPPAGGEAPIDGGFAYYANAWGVLGLHSCALMSTALGKESDASRFEAESNDLREAMHRSIEKTFVRLNDFAGTIPANVEEGLGYNVYGPNRNPGRFITFFGACLVWPTESMSPFDPLMDAWYKYRENEGSFTGGFIQWPYVFADLGVSYIRRGEPDKACDYFYTYVNSASRTFDWIEGAANLYSLVFKDYKPFEDVSRGVPGGGDMPHAQASAHYIRYYRNLLLHEDGDTLHIAPATPRKWLAQPKPIGVENAPSRFGNVTYHLTADPDGTTIRGDIKLDPNRKPSRLLIHIRAPGGRGLKSVRVNGKKWNAFAGDTIIVARPPTNIKLEAAYTQ